MYAGVRVPRGALCPPVGFWGEYEAQALLDSAGEGGRHSHLPHIWPQVGMTGIKTGDFNAWGMLAVGLLKLLCITITVLAGYRGGFIFPLMHAGIALGSSIFLFMPAGSVSLAGATLSLAAAINVAATRTVLSTPLVLTSLTGRVDLFPTILAASIVSMHLTGRVAVITAQAPRGETPHDDVQSEAD